MYFLKQKSELFQKLKERKANVVNQKRRNVKFLRSDNGGEYISSEFKEYSASEGIEHPLTIPGRSEQNVVERMNQTLRESVLVV